MSDVFGLAGHTVVVTGGAQGIGEGIARLLGEVGAKVAVLDLNGDGAAAVADSLPVPAIARQLDIRDKGAIEAATADIVRELGPIKAWVNNVGAVRGDVVKPFLEIERDGWEWMFDVNTTGTMLASQVAITQFLAQGDGGSIVNLSSFQGHRASPHMTAYGAAKAAVAHLTQTLALEFGPAGIRVNAVAPSVVVTPALEREMSAERKAASLKAVPMGRLGAPRDIAGVVVALCSDLMAFVTGQLIMADGGLGLTSARPHRGQAGGGG
jgi:NAD(P)-dependent dehydrogenase (short-subunit alcohol dehydrogenase family)